MRARLDKSQTNQITRGGAGLTQSSGREKVTVTKRVSDEASYRPVHSTFTLKQLLTRAGGYMTDSILFHLVQGYFLVTQTKELKELELFFVGKSECAAMSRLTGMAGKSAHSKLALVK